MLKRFPPVCFVLLALAAYFWGLGCYQIPKIGDEVLYLQIARVTGASGSWLPLRYEPGILNTKPPLLFWLGIFINRFSASLFAMRAGVVIVTLLSASLVYLISKKRSADRAAPYWAAAAYLGFISTFQQGRPFLVNSFEVLFLVLPLAWFFYRSRLDFIFWVLVSLSWGAVAWSKSFALILVGAFALAGSVWILKPEVRKNKSFFILFFSSAVIAGLAIFSLWFVFDPDPGLLFHQFIIGENAVKFKGYANYFRGLFMGAYPVYRIWLGDFANAGIYAVILLGTIVALLRKGIKAVDRQTLSLLWFIVAFLIFYTIPTQRQENYLLPTMAIWAVFFADYRKNIPRIFWTISMGLVVLCFVAFTAAPFFAGTWSVMPPATILLWLGTIGLYIFIFQKFDRIEIFPALVLLCFIQLTNFLSFFETTSFAFSVDSAQTVRVPSRRLAQHERFRFIYPNSVPVPYDPNQDMGKFCDTLARGDFLVLEESALAHCRRKLINQDWFSELKSRQSIGELLKIASGNTEYLVRKVYLMKID